MWYLQVQKTTWDFEPQKNWPSEWLGKLVVSKGDLTPNEDGKRCLIFMMVPSLTSCAVIGFSRVLWASKYFLMSVTLDFTSVLGEADISAGFSPLYLPGGSLLISAFLLPLFSFRNQKAEVVH